MPHSRAAAGAGSAPAAQLSLEQHSSRLLAVNSFDNTLRLYHPPLLGAPPGGGGGSGGANGGPPAAGPADAPSPDAPLPGLECVHRLAGHKNRNWPIKSSIFVGHDYVRGAAQRRGAHEAAAFDGADDAASHNPLTIHETAVVATGSTDHHAYLFDVGGPPGTGELVQRLEGHADRVYATHFHPQEPILASCSADFTIKIWCAGVRSKRTAAAAPMEAWHRPHGSM